MTEDQEEKFPSLKDQALSLGQTMAKSWEEIIQGNANELMVDDYEKQRRYNILCYTN